LKEKIDDKMIYEICEENENFYYIKELSENLENKIESLQEKLRASLEIKEKFNLIIDENNLNQNYIKKEEILIDENNSRKVSLNSNNNLDNSHNSYSNNENRKKSLYEYESSLEKTKILNK